MNPKKILLFLVVVLVALGLLTLTTSSWQTETNTVQEGYRIGDWVVKFPTFASIVSTPKVIENDKALEIMKEAEALVENDSIETKSEVPMDSIPKEELITDTEIKSSGAIYYPDSNSSFLVKLVAAFQKKRCRIIHYGDSQIEVDRITAYIRNKLQREYGGSGPGFIPLKIVYDQKSIEVDQIGNWYRYAAFDRKQRRVAHGGYGLYTTFTRFTPYQETPLDSTKYAQLPISKSSLEINPSKIYYGKLKDYNRIGIHYGNNRDTVTVSVFEGENLIRKDTLKSDGKYHHYKLHFDQTPQDLKLTFEGKISPDFYGLTFDADSGISMDNVPMRGESGRFFVNLDKDVFRQMADELQPDVFIFQFGGNVIPYALNEKQVTGYVRSLMNSIKWVQRRSPNSLFLVVGPGDMSTSINGVMQTYPMLPVLDKEMKKKSLENGFAYWSLYETMGGENSMATWVAKGRASSDYVHFQPKGAELMGELFYKNLQTDLQQIKKE